MATVVSKSVEINPIKYPAIKTTATKNKNKLIGVKTLIGLKNKDNLITNLIKLKKSDGLSVDLP